MPSALHGSDAEYSIRTLSERERLSVENCFFSKGINIALSLGTTAVIVPQSRVAGATLEDVAVLAEFALGVLAVSGFQPISIVATFNGSICSSALQHIYPQTPNPPAYPKKLIGSAAAKWVNCFFEARHRTGDQLHITADRFVRFLKTNNSRDALVDLCICLESLIESQTEVSFRFGVCLAKISGFEKAEESSVLLSDLYDLRSKVVHGSDYEKAHKHLEPSTTRLRSLARAVLTSYILFMSEHTRKEWNQHLRSSLFA